jgi:SpoVK/Ycf46/Vps4 family AAA+-type ATPase
VCNSASKSERGTACALSAEFDRLAANQNDKILVLATVKDGKSLDEQLRRAGRFEKEIKLELPNWQTRL